MKISMLMENTPFAEGFAFEHGLSIHIEIEHHAILFDMGQSDGFLINAERLGIDLGAVDVAVLSHGHYDHGGGLKAFLSTNTKATVYLSRYAFDRHLSGGERDIGLDPALAGHARLCSVGEQLVLDDTLALYACNECPRPFFMDSYGLYTLHDHALIPDDFRHEQYMMIQEHGKRVLISGCSHKGILNIMRWFKPDVLIGGFHFMKVDPEKEERFVLDEAVQGLLEYDTQYYTCHCTGIAQYQYMCKRMGDRVAYLSAGQQIVI